MSMPWPSDAAQLPSHRHANAKPLLRRRQAIAKLRPSHGQSNGEPLTSRCQATAKRMPGRCIATPELPTCRQGFCRAVDLYVWPLSGLREAAARAVAVGQDQWPLCQAMGAPWKCRWEALSKQLPSRCQTIDPQLQRNCQAGALPMPSQCHAIAKLS